MGPDWYFDASEACEEAHDPADFDGRDWDELTDGERDDAIKEYIYGIADSMEAD